MDITPCFWRVLDSIHWWWRGPSPLVRDPMVMVETITAGLETHQCCLNHEKNRLCSTLCVAPHRCPDSCAAAIKSTTTAPRVDPRHCRCRALGPCYLPRCCNRRRGSVRPQQRRAREGCPRPHAAAIRSAPHHSSKPHSHPCMPPRPIPACRERKGRRG